MDLGVDIALAGRTNVYGLISTPDDGLEAAMELNSTFKQPLVRASSTHVRCGVTLAKCWMLTTSHAHRDRRAVLE